MNSALSAIRSILVVKPSSLGDIVHTLPAVELLRRHWPEARLQWLVNPEWAPLLEGNPHVDEVLIFPRGEFRGLRGWLKIPAWAKALREHATADLVIDFQGLLRSALISRLCRGGEVVGLSDAREGARFFYDRAADVRGIDHAVDRYLALTRLVTGQEAPTASEWPLPQGSQPAGFAETPPFILLHPFSRGTGKSLRVDDVSEFCRALDPLRVVIAGRAEQKIEPLDNVTNLLNRTSIPELIWLIRRAGFVVSVDSGPMHIAAALTPRLLAIHTWSDPEKVGPYPRAAWIWQGGRVFQRTLSAPSHPVPNVTELAAFLRPLIAASGPGEHRA